MIPNTMIIPTENIVAIQTPIGTPLLPSKIPSLPLGYNVLNSSIPIPTSIPSEAPRVFTAHGNDLIADFILKLPHPSPGGSYPPLTKGPEPSGTT
jgi:hypothetical protein